MPYSCITAEGGWQTPLQVQGSTTYSKRCVTLGEQPVGTVQVHRSSYGAAVIEIPKLRHSACNHAESLPDAEHYAWEQSNGLWESQLQLKGLLQRRRRGLQCWELEVSYGAHKSTRGFKGFQFMLEVVRR